MDIGADIKAIRNSAVGYSAIQDENLNEKDSLEIFKQQLKNINLLFLITNNLGKTILTIVN